MIARYLADKSAWARMNRRAVARRLAQLVEQGLVGTCGVIDLELLVSARDGEEHAQMRAERRYALERLPMPDEVWDRALEVQGELARRSQHRSVKLPDLLIAATAERHGVAVLHCDVDFDRIAEVTGQDTEWVVPRSMAD